MKSLFAAVLLTGLLVTPVFAQTGAGTWNDLPDHFQIDTGYFRITGNTVLRYNGPRGGGDVDFERDLGIDSGRRHVLGGRAPGAWAGATSSSSCFTQAQTGTATATRLARDFTVGRPDLQRGAHRLARRPGRDILGGYYRFAVYRNDRFEIGPTIGIGYLWLNAQHQGDRHRRPAPAGPPRAGRWTGARASATSPAPWAATPTAWPGQAPRPCAPTNLYIKVNPENARGRSPTGGPERDYYFFRQRGHRACSTSTTSTATTVDSCSPELGGETSPTRASRSSRRSCSRTMKRCHVRPAHPRHARVIGPVPP